jgi:hypothetical protein
LATKVPASLFQHLVLNARYRVQMLVAVHWATKAVCIRVFFLAGLA